MTLIQLTFSFPDLLLGGVSHDTHLTLWFFCFNIHSQLEVPSHDELENFIIFTNNLMKQFLCTKHMCSRMCVVPPLLYHLNKY